MERTRPRLREVLVEGPASVGQRMRARRWDWFRAEFPDIESMSVVDLGGTVEAWLRAPVQPACVHVVNLAPQSAMSLPGWIRADVADACDLPDRVIGHSYDLVFSNSVLEHVGGHAQRARFAEAVHKLAGRHWVQTPYRYFPVEPHWLFPGFQFLPLAARARVSHRWPLTHTRPANKGEGLTAALWVDLVGRCELAYLFPTSVIRAERLAGMTKSLIAVKSA
jgi:hypothetical protein